MKIEIRKYLRDNMPNIKFALLVAGNLQFRDDHPLLLNNIELLLYNKLLDNEFLFGSSNIFLESNVTDEGVVELKKNIQKIIDNDSRYFSTLIVGDKEDPVIYGETILAPNVVVARMNAWRSIYDLLLIALSNDPHSGFLKFPDSLTRGGRPNMKFLYEHDNFNTNEPLFLHAFAKLTAAHLTKDRDIQKIKIGTRYDKAPIYINIQVAEMEMRQVLGEHGFAVRKDVFKESFNRFSKLNKLNTGLPNNSSGGNINALSGGLGFNF